MTAARPNARPLLIALFAALTIVSLGCGGREDAADSANSASSTTPPPSADGGTAPQDGELDELGMTPEQRAALKNFAAQRAAAGLPPKRNITRIELAPGEERIELPEEYPEDIPLAPGSDPTQYMSAPDRGMMTVLTIQGDTNETRTFYQEALAEAGWDIDVDKQGAGLMMLTAYKDGRSLAVALTDEGEQTTVTLLETHE